MKRIMVKGARERDKLLQEKNQEKKKKQREEDKKQKKWAKEQLRTGIKEYPWSSKYPDVGEPEKTGS